MSCSRWQRFTDKFRYSLKKWWVVRLFSTGHVYTWCAKVSQVFHTYFIQSKNTFFCQPILRWSWSTFSNQSHLILPRHPSATNGFYRLPTYYWQFILTNYSTNLHAFGMWENTRGSWWACKLQHWRSELNQRLCSSVAEALVIRMPYLFSGDKCYWHCWHLFSIHTRLLDWVAC